MRESREKLKQKALRENRNWGGRHLLRTLEFLTVQRVMTEESKRTIAGYWPIGSELCLLPEAADASDKQKNDSVNPNTLGGRMTWQLPVTLPSKELSWFDLSPDVANWPRDKRGLPLPPPHVTAGRFAEHHPAPWIVLVPCLAADRAGFRLGYGGGYYDRFLEQNAQSCLTIACVPEELLLDCGEIPIENHDCPVDLVVTEQEIIKPRPKQLLEKIKLFNC